MYAVAKGRRPRSRLGILLLAIVAIGSLGMTWAHAEPPFTVSITEPVGQNELTVTMSGTADSPSSATHKIDIDWGDGNTDSIPLDGNGPWAWGPIDHTYAAGGTYTIVATIIHSEDSGNDQGQSASDSTVVELPDCPEEGCPEPDPCVENPSDPACNPEDPPTDPPADPPAETPPPAAKPKVLPKTHQKPLAHTANETTMLMWTGLLLLMVGATIRFCAAEPRPVVVAERATDELVARSLDLVTRLVRTRDGSR